MAQTQPRVTGLDIITADPVTGYVTQGVMNTAAAVPAGATYAGIFAVSCILQILAGAGVGQYKNTGTVAVPAWTAF